jgi:hypothetical protein
MKFRRRAFPPSKRKAPVRFELAPTAAIDKYESVAPEFFQKILDIDRNDCLITDESCLWDFHGEMSNDSIYSKILEVYGVDVSDVEGSNLAKIFQRIVEARRR